VRTWTPGSGLLAQLARLHVTFGAVRGITYSIKDGKGPFGNLSVGGEHLHHYMWGIGLVSGSGASPYTARTPTAGTRW